MDEKAKRILLTAYWGAGGWKSGKVPKADFEYARDYGLMFDPISITHDELIERTIQIRDALTGHELARGLLASLTSRELHWRSAIARSAA